MSAESASANQARRVVITGVGAVTALGQTAETFWKACLAGCSGVSPITGFDTTGYTTRFAAEIKDWDPRPTWTKRMRGAWRRSCSSLSRRPAWRWKTRAWPSPTTIATASASISGRASAGLASSRSSTKILLERGPGRISPFIIPGIICDMGAGMVSILLGVRGPNSCITTACATGTNNIGDAYHIIRRGDADAMIAGGAEAGITPLAMAGFCQARSLSQRNDEPEHASRPFDANRDGFVMGEGSGVLVLEALEAAQARGAKIYAELVGYGASGRRLSYHQPARRTATARSAR